MRAQTEADETAVDEAEAAIGSAIEVAVGVATVGDREVQAAGTEIAIGAIETKKIRDD